MRSNNKENNNHLANGKGNSGRYDDDNDDNNSNETTNYDEQSMYSASIHHPKQYNRNDASLSHVHASSPAMLSSANDSQRNISKASVYRQQQQQQAQRQQQFDQQGGNRRRSSSENRSVTPSAVSNKSRSPSLRSFKSDTLRSELTQSSFRSSQHMYENRRAQSAGPASKMAQRYDYLHIYSVYKHVFYVSPVLIYVCASVQDGDGSRG